MKMKKWLSILLSIVIMCTLTVPAFATEPVQSNQQAEIPEGFVLFDSETSLVDDGTGNLVEVTVEEYRSLVVPFSTVGEKRYYTFNISNNALGIASITAGAPLTKAVRQKIANIVAQKLGEKIGANFIPGLNVVSWILGTIGTINACFGNNGFRITVSVVYTEIFENKEGVYHRGWDLSDLTLSTY